ncbi:MAG: DUF1015 domain-containing protein [Clostridia bacterium]|nr:DUF1015 domain-containing protein [Clostridia bacterium]
MKNLCFSPADILLPDFTRTDGEKWAVIACDQFTSEPEYWEEAARFVGDAPSALSLILPECYLAERGERTPRINAAMASLAEGDFFKTHKNAVLYLERTCPDGRVRRGLIGKVDLECYGYGATDTLPIRATEGTVLDRIPPRVEIRRDAPLELPHVMLLIDDREGRIIEGIAQATGGEEIYRFPLMAGGGSVRGVRLTDDEVAAIDRELCRLASPEEQRKKYGAEGPALLFAVGDGNHSLATAKAIYEELKTTIGAEAAARHPARYALCEVVNLHDAALDFEPIYRVVTNTEPEALLSALTAYTEAHGDPSLPKQEFTAVTKGGRLPLSLSALHVQPVGTLQAFLDDYMKTHPEAEVDYIHDEASLCALSERPHAIGFLFRGMEKADLFPAVAASGPLPRKTFSMGHARDKRYYLEARRIRP